MSYYYNQPRRQQSWSDYQRSQVMNKVGEGLTIATITVLIVLFAGLPWWVYPLAWVVELITVIGYYFAKSEEATNRLYYAFVVASAVVLGYTIGYVIVGLTGGVQMVFYTFGLTTAVVGGTFYYTSRNKPQTAHLGRYLFMGVIGLLLVMIAGIFIPFSSGFNLIISIFGAILFTAYLYYDLGRMENEQYISSSRMAWQIYWDILLIFKFILRMFIYSSDR